MDKKSQVEKIAFMLGDVCNHVSMDVCTTTNCNHCRAEYLYGAGCRLCVEAEWVLEHETYGKMVCSNCGEEAPTKTVVDRTYTRHILYDKKPFCPNCGAKMKGGSK